MTVLPDYYTHFIIGESMLEVYGRETAGIEQNAATAKTKLSEAERHLKVVLKDNGKVGILSCLRQNGTPFYQVVYGRETAEIEQNTATAKTKLSEVERHLKVVLIDNGKVDILPCLHRLVHRLV